ncbi:DUF551 domain-containing protein [Cronobacter muytjensii]|nr:DUF551 domain-containing protein [Cronobacter muytjensii]
MSTINTEQAKDLRNAFECWQQDYDPVEDKEQYDMFGLGVVAMDELLALRKEREPVAWRWNYGGSTDWRLQEVEPSKGDNKRCPRVIQPIYAAPQLPQPAVVDADDNFYSWFGREWHENYQHNQYTTAAKQMLGVMAESAWRAGRSAAMLQGVERVQVWISCSERMPDSDGNYWCWWDEDKRQGPGWFIKSDLMSRFQSSEITHWMPLPEPPCK